MLGVRLPEQVGFGRQKSTLATAVIPAKVHGCAAAANTRLELGHFAFWPSKPIALALDAVARYNGVLRE